ncbi:YvrJ family protein [Natranaerobius trueperi]|uniref:YvrJ family protein n=1 Tax=Natranaerobius trueperi TaxID=759412 RepID=A0A226BUL3_9FIRM|nr:YvrJ family protein [Natranaerobius trueperi]OWZ82686.1 YvrJ family protein [Natranaerobius trueperi]
MDSFSELIANLGFPIAVTAFLLIRLEHKLNELNDTILSVMKEVIKKEG